jgi:hypothetical protein
MAFIRIRQIILRTGRMLLLGMTLLLVEQIPFNEILYGANPHLKKAQTSQKDSAASSRKILAIDSDITSPSGEIINIVLTGNFPPEAQVIEGDIREYTVIFRMSAWKKPSIGRLALMANMYCRFEREFIRRRNPKLGLFWILYPIMIMKWSSYSTKMKTAIR